MYTETNQIKTTANRPRRSTLLPPLTAEELHVLKARRYITKHDVMRFLQISETTFYKYLRQGKLKASLQFTKKLYDLDEIYRSLDEAKQR